MEKDLEQEGLEALTRIEGELEEIKERTPSPRRAFTNGLLQGAGALLGGVVAIVILGWVLSLFGLVPGLSYIASVLQDASAHFRSR